MTVRVLVVDDHPVVRAGLRALLTRPGVEVVGEASVSSVAIALTAALTPDVVVMDFEIRAAGGIATTRAIKEAHPGVSVLLLTTYETRADIARALAAGAFGCVSKDAGGRELIACVCAAATNGTQLSH